jgi:hypothetical protein
LGDGYETWSDLVDEQAKTLEEEKSAAQSTLC